MSIILNDKMHQRGLHHKNLLIIKDDDEFLIIEFEGKNIPGVVQITNKTFSRMENGLRIIGKYH